MGSRLAIVMSQPCWRLYGELAAGLGGSYPLDRVLRMRDELVENHALCVAIGLINKGQLPRLKLYFQEDSWDTGVGDGRPTQVSDSGFA